MAIFQGSEDQNKQPIFKNVKAKSVLRYTMMPEILPRIRALGLHFGHFAYLLALVFSSARLIPASHPVLNAANIGRYGVRQVIAMAANNITWSKNNIDQIAIFSAIVIGLIMIVIQAGLIAVAALMGMNPAEAQTTSFFETPNPQNDPIMILFANVFGDLNDFWGTGVAANAPNSNNVIHEAVRAMLSLYSMAMMVIAVIIVLYYIMTVVGEAAKTGTPFGQRFNSLWAPIRLVIALGLLVPLGTGLNSAQYLTLWIAKAGSGLGTQVWNVALNEFDTSGSQRFILDDFNGGWVRELAAKIFVMEVCSQAHNKYNRVSVGASEYVSPIVVENRSSPELYKYTITYQTLDPIDISPDTNCGTISISMSEEEVASLTSAANVIPTADIFQATVNAIDRLVFSAMIKGQAESYVGDTISVGGRTGTLPAGGMKQLLDFVMIEADTIDGQMRTELQAIADTKLADSMNEFISSRGDSWVYAGTYYMEISRIIQASHDAKMNAIPNTVMTAVSGDVNATEYADPWYMIFLGGDNSRVIKGTSEETTIAVMNLKNFYQENIKDYIKEEDLPKACVGIGAEDEWYTKLPCLIFAMIVPNNLVLLAEDSTRSIDPMAALVRAGYEIVDRSWKLLLGSLAVSAFGGVLSFIPIVGSLFAGTAAAVAPVLTLLATFGLAAGVILYFMLPIFPFMYFFFAIVSWVMEIFEAIIAMPLWALAHLRIDGDGMPGQAAINGYYLLLAILLRPALIVVGLIAGIIIFSGVTFLLQTLWRDVLLVKNAGNMSGLEVLIYTIIFAYFCYSAALTSFKLVDTIPNQILRWIGNGTPTFSDGKEDPMGQSNALLTGGAGLLAGQGLQTINQGASGIGQSLVRSRKTKPSPNDEE